MTKRKPHKELNFVHGFLSKGGLKSKLFNEVRVAGKGSRYMFFLYK